MSVKVHVAADPVGLKQTCRMCGYILSDNEGRAVAIDPEWSEAQIRQALRPSFWAPGAYVAVDGNMSGTSDVEERIAHPCDAKENA